MDANQFVATASMVDGEGVFRNAVTALRSDMATDQHWDKVALCWEDGSAFDKATAYSPHFIYGDNVVGYTESGGRRWLTLRCSATSGTRTATVVSNQLLSSRTFPDYTAFTIEFRFKFERVGTQASDTVIQMFGSPGTISAFNRLGFCIDAEGALRITSGNTLDGSIVIAQGLVENTEYEIALQMGEGAGRLIRGFVNGLLVSENACPAQFSNMCLAGAYGNYTAGFYLAFTNAGTAAEAWVHINRLRITNGVARYGTGYIVLDRYCPYQQAPLDQHLLNGDTLIWVDAARCPPDAPRELSHGYALNTLGNGNAIVTPEGGLRCIRNANHVESAWTIASPVIDVSGDFFYEATVRLRGPVSNSSWITNFIRPEPKIDTEGAFNLYAEWSASNVIRLQVIVGNPDGTVIRPINVNHPCISRMDGILCIKVWRVGGVWGANLNGMSYINQASYTGTVRFSGTNGIRFGWSNPHYPMWIEINSLRITSANRNGEWFNQELTTVGNNIHTGFPNQGGIVWTGDPTLPL